MKAGEGIGGSDRASGECATSPFDGATEVSESNQLASTPSAPGVRRSQFAQHWARQNPHSVFTAAAGLLFSATIIIDVVLDRPGIDPALLWVLLAFCLSFSGVAFLMARDFPVFVGLVCVGVFVGASIYFIGPWGDQQSAISSAQEVPILALYLGWFVPRPLGRILMLVITAILALSFAVNPDFHPDGVFGVPTAAQTLVIALFCFEIGSMLWRKSERQIRIDPLTGVLNRAGFLEKLRLELARSVRTGHPLSLVMIDFDHFKQLNDTQGHSAGDEALVRTVDAWRAAVRAGDVIGRTGGDEFAILLDKTDAHGAQQIMRRLRDASPHAWSWGIAQSRLGDDGEELFARADGMLYASKRARV